MVLSGSLSLAVHSGFPLDLHANVNRCIAHAEQVEQRHRLPLGLLRAIALVESGWSPAGGGVPQPWPWAVGSRGQGRFFATKSAAVDFVEALQATGEWNIDVGCMQINLHYHGSAFDTVAEVLDPARNVHYAANLLSKLATETGSWRAAIGRYHSADPVKALAYLRKVEKIWGHRRSASPGGPTLRAPPVYVSQEALHILTESLVAVARTRALTMPAHPEIVDGSDVRLPEPWAEILRNLAEEAE